MASQEKWYFTKEQLMSSPSRKCGLDPDKELAYRQQAANLIQDMGQKLQVTQLCINTAIVYMHRFYAFHSFTQFHRNSIAAAALFLAAKVEEQPRKLEYVIKVAHVCLHRNESASSLDPRSEHYQELAQDLVFNENVLLQTLGFDVAIDHPHTHVVRTCHLVKAPKDLAQTSYFMASNSLHLTTMCLQYKPTVVACFCINLATKWSNWAIPQSNEGKHWFQYVDRTVTTELLEKLTAEFLHIFDKCPSRLKKKMNSMNGLQSSSGGLGSSSSHRSSSDSHSRSMVDDGSFDREYEKERHRPSGPGSYVPVHGSSGHSSGSASSSQQVPPPNKIDLREYREKKEREMRHHQQQQQHPGSSSSGSSRAPSQHKPNHHRQHSSSSGSSSSISHQSRSIPPSAVGDQQQMSQQRDPSASSGSSRPEQVQPRTRPPSLFSPENTTAPHQIASARRPNVPPTSTSSNSSNSINSQTSTSHPHHQQQPIQRKPHPSSSAPPSSQSNQGPPPPYPHHSSKVPPRKRPTEHQPGVPPQQINKHQQQPHGMPTSSGSSQQMGVQQSVKRPAPSAVANMQPHDAAPPPAKKPSRNRTGSSSSEPELVPVVKKLEDMPQYDRLMHGSSRTSLPPSMSSTSSMVQKQSLPQKESRPPPAPPVNSIETDPALVSNLLKESLMRAPPPITVPQTSSNEIAPPKPAASHTSSILQQPHIQPHQPIQQPPAQIQQVPPQQSHYQQQQMQQQPLMQQPPVNPLEMSHKSEKKKKKEKHKHKDRKDKEERKKHKKDKDREKSKHKESTSSSMASSNMSMNATAAAAQMPQSHFMQQMAPQAEGLKIKIPKDRLAVPPPYMHGATPPSLKLKIPKDMLRPGGGTNGQQKDT